MVQALLKKDAVTDLIVRFSHAIVLYISLVKKVLKPVYNDFFFLNEIPLYTHTLLGEVFDMQGRNTASVKTAVKRQANGNDPDKKNLC